MSQTPEDAARLSTLVNPDRIRGTIKRLFHNRIDEVLAELFQNSQRSGSTLVEITTTENSFTVHDNGHGLLNGIDGFHTLLKIAESHFDNETIEDQDPMGVGIVSLLTHDQVNEVTFSSGALELTIDTKRWWDEQAYYSTWFQRVLSLDEPVTGLRITVKCAPQLVQSIHTDLKPKDQVAMFTDRVFACSSPAQGYEGILDITLNAEPVRTSLPNWVKQTSPLIVTTYKGCKLEIRYDASRARSSALWYGQLIILRDVGDFQYHLEVKAGRPVNPLSPTRAGLIQDAAYDELREFVKAKIFKVLFDTKNRAKLRPAYIESCYKLDPSYANEECPYIVAERVPEMENPNSFEDFDGAHQKPDTRLFLYSEQPQLLNEHVTVQLPDKSFEAEHGLRSFLSDTGPAYVLRHGDSTRLTIGTLWWTPKGEAEHDWFYQPGEFGISFDPEEPPSTWTAITHSPVFVFNSTGSCDVGEVDFTVGTSESPIGFLQVEAWAAFWPSDEHDYDPQEGWYRESLEFIIRAIIGKCVPQDFKLHEVSRFLKDKAAPIIEIKYHFKCGGKFINPRRAYKPNSKNAGAMSPAEITVKNSVGERVRLKLY